MNERLAAIEDRWRQIDADLADLWDGRVCDDPAAREAALLAEQDELEYEVGLIHFDLRGA
jgi:hypothetical protein